MKYYLGGTTKYDLKSVHLSLEPGYSHIIDCFIIAARLNIAEKFLNTDEVEEFFSHANVQLENCHIFDSTNSSPLTKGYAGLGADRIAKLAGALAMFPDTNIMLMDFGTATTLNLVNKNHEFIGGFVHLGLQAQIEAIPEKLQGFPNYTETEAFKNLVAGVNLTEIFPEESAAKAVIEGAYREHLAMIQYYKTYASEKFKREKFISIATGGNAGIFASEFDESVDSRELLESFVENHLTKKPSLGKL